MCTHDATAAKLVDALGGGDAAFPLAVEVAPVFCQKTLRAIGALPALAAFGATVRLRHGTAPAGHPGAAMPGNYGGGSSGKGSGGPFVTDNGNYVADVTFARPVTDAAAVAEQVRDKR